MLAENAVERRSPSSKNARIALIVEGIRAHRRHRRFDGGLTQKSVRPTRSKQSRGVEDQMRETEMVSATGA